VRYAEIRPYAVPETLEELAGPAAGVVVLATVLDWTPKPVYDLSDDVDLRMLYETVIRDSGSVRFSGRSTVLSGARLQCLWWAGGNTVGGHPMDRCAWCFVRDRCCAWAGM
jgi:hypothetical protein